MRLSAIVSLALAACSASWATAAAAADNLDCISQGYSAEQTAWLESFQAEFRATDLNRQSDDPRSAELMQIVSTRAAECADQHGWSADAIENAVFFRMFSVLRGGLLHNSPLTPAQMQRLDQAFASADQARLRSLVAGMLDPVLSGGAEPEPGREDSLFLGRLIIRAGVPVSEANAQFVGAYLGTVVGPQIYAERFASR